MKLYLISQDENDEYDTYDSAVVAADSEDDARNMHPTNGLRIQPNEWGRDFGSWCSSPHFVNVRYLGEAAPDVRRGVICASFNAG